MEMEGVHGKAEERTILCLWSQKGACMCSRGWEEGGGGLHVQVYCIDVKHEFLSHMAVCACNIPALHEDAQQLHKINT